MAGRLKSLVGTVVSDKMEKTVVVAVETTTRHRLYHKIFRRTKRYQAHDDRLDAKVGDQVRILETRPLSRHKRWRVAEVLQRGEVAEVKPKEIDADLIERPREAAAEEVAAAPVAAPAAEEAAGAPEAGTEAAVAEESGEMASGAGEESAEAGGAEAPENLEAPDNPAGAEGAGDETSEDEER